MIPIEVCIHCDDLSRTRTSVRAAFAGGAARIELCRDMANDGLTPGLEFIAAAREIFDRPGVMVMIRPRAGDFCYSAAEIQQMVAEIEMAAHAGADGVVFGPLAPDGQVDRQALVELLAASRTHHLRTTFHRAFDVTPDPPATLRQLMEIGIDRILTSGTPWSSGLSAMQGVHVLQQLLQEAGEKIELVIGGGVKPENTPVLLQALADFNEFSLHVYSGVLENGLVAIERVRQMVAVANNDYFQGWGEF